LRYPCCRGDGYRFAQHHPTKSRASWNRGGSHPRIAPEVPAIADKARAYRETPCPRRIVGAGPAREIARRARSYREWRGWGGVGGSHPRIAPEVPAIADKVRSYGETPCLPADCRSGPCPRNRAQGALLQGMARMGWCRGSHPRIAPEVPAIADKVRSYGETPCFPADCRSGPCPRNRAQGALLQGMVWVGWCRGPCPRFELPEK